MKHAVLCVGGVLFGRQVGVTVAGLCYTLARGGEMPAVAEAALAELQSTAAQAFDGLKDGVMASDAEAIAAAVELLMQVFDNKDFGCVCGADPIALPLPSLAFPPPPPPPLDPPMRAAPELQSTRLGCISRPLHRAA